MSAPILHAGATVRCAHGGLATPATSSPRVLVAGQPVTTLADAYAVAGCPSELPDESPCLTATFIAGAARVRVGGVSVLLVGSPAVSGPKGTPVTVVATQARVTAI